MTHKTQWLIRLIIGVFVMVNIGFAFGISSYELKLGILPLTMAISGINLGIILEMRILKNLERFITFLLIFTFSLTSTAIFSLRYPTRWWWYVAYGLDYSTILLAAIAILRWTGNPQTFPQWHATIFFYFCFTAWQALVIPWIWLAQIPAVGSLTAVLVEGCGVGLLALLAWIALAYHEQKHSFFQPKTISTQPTSLTTAD